MMLVHRRAVACGLGVRLAHIRAMFRIAVVARSGEVVGARLRVDPNEHVGRAVRAGLLVGGELACAGCRWCGVVGRKSRGWGRSGRLLPWKERAGRRWARAQALGGGSLRDCCVARSASRDESALGLARRFDRSLAGFVFVIALARRHPRASSRRLAASRARRCGRWRRGWRSWRCSAARLLGPTLGEELRPSLAVGRPRRLGGLPLIAADLHDALGVSGRRTNESDAEHDRRSGPSIEAMNGASEGFVTSPYGSTSNSLSACATSRICWPSAEWWCLTRRFGAGRNISDR